MGKAQTTPILTNMKITSFWKEVVLDKEERIITSTSTSKRKRIRLGGEEKEGSKTEDEQKPAEEGRKAVLL